MIPKVHEIEMEDKMAEMYNHHTVEKKWQKIWDDEKASKTENDYTKPKFYALVEFPYPSGQGLHVSRIKFIQKRLLRRMLQDLKSSFIHSVILLTGTER